MGEPLAYFITFTTYGTWLPGRAPGSVDREHNVPGTPFLPADAEMEAKHRAALRQEPYFLDEPRRKVVLHTISEVATHRGWKLWAVHVRTNHVHIVVTAASKPEKVMIDFKAWASRCLREALNEPPDRDRWSQHGSTRYLNSEPALQAEIVYVVDRQGEPMACFDSRTDNPNEPEALATEMINPSLTLPARKMTPCNPSRKKLRTSSPSSPSSRATKKAKPKSSSTASSKPSATPAASKSAASSNIASIPARPPSSPTSSGRAASSSR
jgi:REP element-mobilizing transposase RayT